MCRVVTIIHFQWEERPTTLPHLCLPHNAIHLPGNKITGDVAIIVWGLLMHTCPNSYSYAYV